MKTKKIKHNPFVHGGILSALPTTESQKEILATLAIDSSASSAYNESIRMELIGQVNVDALAQAISEVIIRHDALRTTFSENKRNFLIHKSSPVILKTIDLNRSSRSFSDIIKNETKKEFDLINGPLCDFTFVKIDNNNSFLFFTAHHIICDGWSLAVILSEISHLYNSFNKDVSSKLQWPNQFNDFALNEIKEGLNSKNADKEYWLDQYSNSVPVMDLPLDFPRPKFRTYESQRIDKQVNSTDVESFKKTIAKQGSSYYNGLMSVFQILLHQLTASSDLVVGISAAEQSVSGKDDLVGHLVNLLPIRQSIFGNQVYSDFLKDLKGTMLDAFDHQRFTFGSLLNDLKLERDPSRIPLVNIIFNVDQQYPGQGLVFDDLEASYTSNPRHKENFEIFINATSCGNELILECQYNTALFKSSTIDNWLSSYCSILKSITDNPDQIIDDLKFDSLKTSSVELESQEITQAIVVTGSQEEASLLNLWEEVLGFSGFSASDNFFAIGGHSLLAVDICSRVFDLYEIKIDLKDIFERPTIAQLAVLLKSSQKVQISRPVDFSQNKSALKTEVGLSQSQFQAWYIEQLRPGLTTHNLPASILINDRIDHSIFEQSLQIIVNRHESLRTTICMNHDTPFQKINENLIVSLDQMKVSEPDLIANLNSLAGTTFNLKDGPLFSTKLIELAPDKYVFFFMVHHVIWDGWCFDIFFKELNSIYSNLINGQTVELEPLSLTYTDYTLWQKDFLNSQLAADQLNYWKSNLSGELPVLDLPKTYRRGDLESGKAESLNFSITNLNELNLFVKKHNTSLYNVFLTLFNITLSRYSGQDEIIIGTPVRGRGYKELLNIVGYFVNTVAMRNTIDFNTNLENNLQKVTETASSAFANEDIPFKDVLASIPWDRSIDHSPIFQSFFSFQDVSNRSGEFNGKKYTQVNIDKASAHTDLDLWIKAGSESIEGAFEFPIDLFDRASISRISKTFLYLVENINSLVGIPLNECTLIDADQEDELINKMNGPHSTLEFASIMDQFIKQVKLTPNSIAVIDEKSSLTYEQLNDLSDTWADKLSTLGVGSGSLVGLSTQRNKSMLVSLIAILKTGAGYVPLDPGFPQDRLDYMIESSQMKVILVQDELASRFKQDLTFLSIEALERLPKCSFNYKPISSDAIAYVIYTSGSTGLPKGVELPHGAVSNFITSMGTRPGIKNSDRLLAVTTLSFDIAVLELYLPIVKGAAVRIATKEESMNGDALNSIIEKENITVMQATPSTWRLLLASGWKGKSDFKLLCGGEPFAKSLVSDLLPIVGEVWNMYGPTETTVWSTCKHITSPKDKISIGTSIDNTDTYILDQWMKPVPYGSVGELFIGGVGLALGYRGRKDLTDERFLESSFKSGEKIYNTGDLARYLPNGEIECLGRNDGQVKVRGYRIELGEIEVKIAKLSNVDDVVVITREDRPGDVRIVAYIISNSEDIDQMSMRRELSLVLPNYMIPSHFVQLEEFPKTLNEKIDKKNLPSPVETKTEENNSITKNGGNGTSTFDHIKSIWIELLCLNTIDGDDNFFDIGGHSLLSVQLIGRLSSHYKIELPLTAILHYPTLSEFSNHLESLIFSRSSNNGHELSINKNLFNSLIEIRPAGSQNPLFCFHGVGGNVLNYLNLIPYLPSDLPLYGLQSSGVDGKRVYLDSIEAMAKKYIVEIKVVQPKGPYLLAGGSMGGLIAFEVARQLILLGDEIQQIIMFDTFGPDLNLSEVPKSESSSMKTIFQGIRRRFSSLFKESRILPYKLTGKILPHSLRYYEVEKNNYKALWKYRPKALNVDLHLIRALSEPTGWYSDEFMGWRKIISGKIHTCKIDASHNDFIESPYFGPALKNVLDEK